MYTSLVNNLTEMNTIIRQLYDWAVEKKAVLVEVDNARLTDIINIEEYLLKELGKIERDKNAILAQLNTTANLGIEIKTLQDIKSAASEHNWLQLEKVANELLNMTSELTKVNDINNQLLKQAINVVTFGINRLTQAQASPVYASQKAGITQETTNTKKVFDFKA